MATLYLITGPAGVGKSTISKLLAKKLEKSALIEGDAIYHHVIGGYVPAWKPGNHLQTFLKVSLNTINIYLEDGFDVVFNYVLAPESVEMFKNQFKKYDIKFVLLLVDEKTILERDKLRPVDEQMKDRCIILLNHFKKMNFDKRFVLDTSSLSVDETVDNIIKNDNFKM